MTDSFQPLTRQQIAWRVAQDIPDGSYVNLGVGIPLAVAQHIPPGREIMLQSENGVIGIGPAPPPEKVDWNLINAGKHPITLAAGGCFFHHADSFAMIRGGHIDYCILGAFQVSEKGDIANWTLDNDTMPPAVGGAMDLVAGARAVYVATEHCTRDGSPKILPECTLPLTGRRCVSRIYTDLAILDVVPSGLRVLAMVPGLSAGALQELTGARLVFAESAEQLCAPEAGGACA